MKISDYEATMKNRELFYRFLSGVFIKEISPKFLNHLKNSSYPDNCQQLEMEEGYKKLEKFFKECDSEIVIEDLAVDYAKVFLAAGEAKGNAAFPYESVYTSKKGILMQESWAEVKAIYATKKLGISNTMSDIKEDHIAMELQYMALLCKEFVEGTNSNNLNEQIDFLQNHLLNWVPKLCADIEKYSRSDFYKAIAKITEGYLNYDMEILKELSADEKIEEGASYTLSFEDMNNFFSTMKKDYKFYAPKYIGKQKADGEEVVRYGEVNSVEEIVYDKQSDFSAKEVYYPIIQTMIKFTEDSCSESKMLDNKGIIMFVHPCDINALSRLDNIFIKNGKKADVYYKRLRDKVKIVLMECTESYKNCYCVSMGSNVADDYSLAVRMKKDECKVQVKDSLFIPYFEDKTPCDFKPSFVTSNDDKVNIPDIKNREDVKMASNLEFWNEYNDKCISCGGCNTVCPTCSCFDTVDVIYNETSREGERRRVWSSCMLETFTMTAGGNKARKNAGQNMRFKTLHKVYDYRVRFGVKENMCVGCGRCIERCPESISFINTINTLHDELEKAKLEKGGCK